MGQKCESSLNIGDKSNVLTQLSKSSFIFFLLTFEEIFIFMIFGERIRGKWEKIPEKSVNF